MLNLKIYQQNALDALRKYLKRAREIGAKDAFEKQAKTPYLPVSQLPDLPYVCLRVPTGGGKTLIASHAVAIAAQEYLRQERSVVLWIAPTNTIKAQTIDALKNLQHPYRQALDETLGHKVNIMDLNNAMYSHRPKFDSGTTIIVTTFAALRVEDTKGRKVYEQNGYLMSHFSDLPEELRTGLECHSDGQPISSLANALRLRRPILIMDEAHRARTPLSFDTLARFNPSCALELTATPDVEKSKINVLYQVSAYELKAEHMIKLPLHLETRADWKATLGAMIEKRNEIEKAAQQEQEQTGEYIRPIALVQAEPKRKTGGTLSVEIVKAALLDLNVPKEHIAIETGELSELSGVNVLSETCPVRFIITVDKLREGWDCPFAYLLCSVRELRSAVAIEQILGRVLRMPKATRKVNEALNASYALVTSHHFAQVASTLADALVSNGLTRYEAQREVKQEKFDFPETGLFKEEEPPAPSEQNEVFAIPQLAMNFMGELEPIDESFFSHTTIRLDECDAELTDAEFPAALGVQKSSLDINAQGRQIITAPQYVTELQTQLSYLNPHDITTPAQLVAWLDRSIPHAAVTQKQAQNYLNRLVDDLLKRRGFTLDALARKRLALRDAAALKMQNEIAQVRSNNWQRVLFDNPPAELVTTSACPFLLQKEYYPSQPQQDGARYPKHYYPIIGKMDNREEEDCAALLASLPNVKFWVRNLVRAPGSFSLPTPKGRFYPDFLAQLENGQSVIIEYKGREDPKSKYEEEIGNFWADRSSGKCVFLFLTKDTYNMKLQHLSQSAPAMFAQ